MSSSDRPTLEASNGQRNGQHHQGGGSVIFCTPHSWSGAIQVGSHHLLRSFAAQGWRAAAVSLPISPFHLLLSAGMEGTRERVKVWWRNGARTEEGIFVYSPFSLAPHNPRWPFRASWTLKHWPRTTIPSLRHVLKRAGFDRPDLLVIDNPVMEPMLDLVDARNSAYRVLDYLPGFASTTPEMLQAERRIAQRVDVVIHSARTLEGYVDALKPRRSALFLNGVDFEHFQGESSEPPEYADIPKPRAIYVGALGPWVDLELLTSLARDLPEISFVIIAPTTPDIHRNAPKNMYFLGARSFKSLPNYLHNSQVGLIPFDTLRHKSLVDGVCPLKLFEYLACGLPVVASATKELRSLEAPIALCDTRQQFSKAVKRAACHDSSPSRRISFARQFDWSRRCSDFAALAQGRGA